LDYEDWSDNHLLLVLEEPQSKERRYECQNPRLYYYPVTGGFSASGHAICTEYSYLGPWLLYKLACLGHEELDFDGYRSNEVGVLH
jgi:hypothetical protein